jgi:hypothetical protein
MFQFDRNALVTITPRYDQEFGADARFRWNMHVALPFPFPSRKCLHENATIAGNEYSFDIHNHYDRLFITPVDGPSVPRVTLYDRNRPLETNPKLRFSREILQSVAVFQDKAEKSTPNEAFGDASSKIQSCFQHLTDFLANQQIQAPYLSAWLVYPISLFDVGTIYHSVDRFCKEHDRWEPFVTVPAISIARRLQHPLFFLEAMVAQPSHPLIEPANELLAEAQMSLFRSMPRLTVLNSYGAVELLGNAVFKKVKTEWLLSNSVPQAIAESVVEEERQRHKTEPSFLFHRGLKECCGRSLLDEDKGKYDGLIELQRMRHTVAHTGHKPTHDEARAGHKLACECVRWLAGVGGLPVKSLAPDNAASVPGFSMTAADSHAINAQEIAFLKHSLGCISSSESPK